MATSITRKLTKKADQEIGHSPFQVVSVLKVRFSRLRIVFRLLHVLKSAQSAAVNIHHQMIQRTSTYFVDCEIVESEKSSIVHRPV